MSYSAFEVLQHLAKLSQSAAVNLPAEVDEIQRQSGVGFSLLGRRFVAPMGQVAEMLDLPVSTRLPGVQPWVLGLANIRGRLLPLFDLARFFGKTAMSQKKQQKVLVIDTNRLYSGLVVDQSFGMQHFTKDLFRESATDVPEPVKPYVNGEYVDAAGISWAVFDMSTILVDPRFMNAAAS